MKLTIEATTKESKEKQAEFEVNAKALDAVISKEVKYFLEEYEPFQNWHSTQITYVGNPFNVKEFTSYYARTRNLPVDHKKFPDPTHDRPSTYSATFVVTTETKEKVSVELMYPSSHGLSGKDKINLRFQSYLDSGNPVSLAEEQLAQFSVEERTKAISSLAQLPQLDSDEKRMRFIAELPPYILEQLEAAQEGLRLLIEAREKLK
ncbi:MAG TPA: hypothetical protein VGO21_00145 [Candidatus Paceibacterota bacterium]|jgi:hypothetical protein|nr:hypothetical protein [Candidatus Paceibacterota bacterium]